MIELPGVNGWVGDVDGTPLLKATVECKNHWHQSKGEMIPAEQIVPIYVRRLGSGQVLSCIIWGDCRGAFNLTSPQFQRRCVNWLAAQ